MRVLLVALLVLYGLTNSAQPPALIPYQAIARDAAGNAVLNQNIGLRFSIHDQTITGNVVWQEVQTVLSNALGVVVTSLGSVSDLSTVNWAQGDKFLQVEMDIAGGTNYSDMGTQQMMSVPYALYAGVSGNGISGLSASGDTLYLSNGEFILIPGLSAANINGGGNNWGGASDSTSHSCGAPNVHNPELTYGTMTDQEGNVYKTIVIGTQEWMAENLNTSRYRNGNAIPTNLSPTAWASTTNGAWSYYNNEVGLSCPYGKLYNWYACNDARQICPAGWHLPSNEDWILLVYQFGGVNFAGGALRSTGTNQDASGYWTAPNAGATNISGFSALPGGQIDLAGSSLYYGNSGLWWTSTQDTPNTVFSVELSYAGVGVGAIGAARQRNYGISVRCIRD